MASQSPYEILGISMDASTKEIRLAYLRLAKQHHPDRNSNDPDAAEKFKRIQAAYETLMGNKGHGIRTDPFDHVFKGNFSFDSSHPFAAFYEAMKRHYKPPK